jgi:hypothetical protein
MMRNVHRSLAKVVVIIGIVWSANARGAEPEKVTQAREIALAAGDDLDAGHFQDALDKVSQAEALYHAPTHMVIRAEALEGLGRLAEALDTYETLAAEPLSRTAPAAFRKAREDGRKRQVALIARVPSLLVLVSGADAADIAATIDGKTIPLTADQATRCDPGKHMLRIEAKGFRTIEHTVELAERGGVVKLNVRLEKETEQVEVLPPPPPPPPPVPKRTLFVPTIVSFGVGAASIAVGAATGMMSISRASELDKQCASDGRCPPSTQATIDQGQLLGNVSTVTFIVGGAALGTGVVLLILGKPKARSTGMFRSAVPWMAPGMIGVRGSF